MVEYVCWDAFFLDEFFYLDARISKALSNKQISL